MRTKAIKARSVRTYPGTLKARACGGVPYDNAIPRLNVPSSSVTLRMGRDIGVGRLAGHEACVSEFEGEKAAEELVCVDIVESKYTPIAWAVCNRRRIARVFG